MIWKSRVLKVRRIIKPVDAYGRAEYYRPDGTVYQMENIMIYLVELQDGTKTLAGKINGDWMEAFTDADGINTIKVV
ncbi:MAG: hypothetical protein DRI61_11365 [Chloroflexi bacterium]|nr:MAG: hypothetical protein DRI61_11365 [Chloroflexota bacterium]